MAQSYTLLRILPFHTFVTQVRIEPGCNDWKANVLITTLRHSQHCSCSDKNGVFKQNVCQKGNGGLRLIAAAYVTFA